MIEIIPAIDLINGKCVRLKQGDFSQKTIYSENPLEVAKAFEAGGLKRLHIVDLDGAKMGRIANLSVLEDIASNTNLSIDFGGGIKTDNDLISVFDAGAEMAGIGSIAVKEPDRFDRWLAKYGSGKIILGADTRDGKVSINGWQETTELDLIPFLGSLYGKGVRKVFVTDISKDGLLEGSAKRLYKTIIEAFPGLHLIASGGVDSIDEVVLLEDMGCGGVIIGKAIYENRISIEQLGQWTSG